MQDLRRALAAIRAVAAASQGDYALADVVAQMCREVALTLGFDRVGISRFEETPEGGLAVGLAAYGMGPEGSRTRLPLAETPLFARACESRELVHVADARSEPALPGHVVDEFGVTSVFVLPLLSEARCVGFLAGDRGGAVFRLDETEIDLLNTVGVIAAALLERDLLREEMRRLDAAKTQFVAFASHELRAPIQMVYGVLATLHHRGTELSETQRVHLRAAAFEQAERLRQLVDQLLNLSRLDTGAVSLAPAPTHVRSLLEEIVLLVAEQRAKEVDVAVADDLEARLDRSAIDRVVSNLLTNALRHGSPPVRVEAEQVDRHLRIRIVDGGHGVPIEFVPQLFDRFTRADRTEATAEGSGLGLSIARSYALAHGGDLIYRPNKPRGACFELVVPTELH